MEPEQARFRLFDSITTFLRSISRSRPLVLVLDDLHWADNSSLLLLEYAAEEISGSRILLLGTYRDIELSRRHPLSDTLAQLLRDGNFSRVVLRGLLQEETKALIEAIATARASEALTKTVHSHTEGNPFFVSEVVPLLLEGGELQPWSEGFSVPEGIRESIGRRLNKLSERCNRVLTTASVIGREFDFKLLCALSDTPEDELLDVIDEALSAGVVEEVLSVAERYQFSHALIQQTLADELSASRRVRLHARVAQEMQQVHEGEDHSLVAQLAHHFVQAATVLGTDQAIRYLAMAGQQALRSRAYDEALKYFSQALEFKTGRPMNSQTAEILWGLGQAEEVVLGRGGVERHQRHLEQAFEFYYESGDAAHAIDVAASITYDVINVTEIPGIIGRALELVPSDSHQAARLLPRYMLALGTYENDHEGAKREFQRGMAIAGREDDLSLEVALLFNMAKLDLFFDEPEECLQKCSVIFDLARTIDSPVYEAEARKHAVRAHLMKGRPLDARFHGKMWLALAERLHRRLMIASAYASISAIDWLTGDSESARRLSDQALELAPHDSRQLASRAVIECVLGNVDPAWDLQERLIEASAQVAPGANFESSGPALAIPLMAYITGVNKNLNVAESAARVVLESPIGVPFHVMSARAGLALLAVVQGDHGRAAGAYELLAHHTGKMLYWDMISSDRLLGILAYCLGDANRALSHFEDALEFCENAGYATESAWVSYELARAKLDIHGHDSVEKARGLLEKALAIASEIGMQTLTRSASELMEVAESTQPPGAASGLTERELEVLGLVARGMTNPQVARHLFISVNTVTRHLSHVYSKTQTAGRAEAVAYAARANLL